MKTEQIKIEGKMTTTIENKQMAITDYIPPKQKIENFPAQLNFILHHIGEINYLLEANINTDDEVAARNCIHALHIAQNEYQKSQAKADAHFYEPSDSEICSILCLYILQVAEECKHPVGMIEGASYFFNGKYWEMLSTSQLEAFLSLSAFQSGIKRAKAESSKFVKLLCEQFTITAQIPIPESSADTTKVNLVNGTLEIHAGNCILKPHYSGDVIRYMLPYEYHFQATCEKFQAFLDKVLPEKESHMVLAEYLGYVFTKNMKLEKCLVLVGSGMNGKSVVYDIVERIFGNDRISSFTLSELADEKGYNRAQLSGKLLNYSSELGANNCNPDMVKKLFSNEPITARSPYGKPFSLRNYCKFMFNANSLPTKIEQTPAYFRRFMFMEFNYKVKNEEKNIHLAQELFEAEANGIFIWILNGLTRLLEQKDFTRSQAMDATLERVKRQSNSVAEFLSDNNYCPSTSKKVPLKVLNEAYVIYCKECNFHPVGRTELARRLRDLNYEVIAGTNNVRMVYCELIATGEPAIEESWIDGVLKLNK